jgi:hypothetical protein
MIFVISPPTERPALQPKVSSLVPETWRRAPINFTVIAIFASCFDSDKIVI